MSIEQLTPNLLWSLFAKICAIPHPSHHEEALVKQIQSWADEHGIHHERDAIGNVLLRKPASAGMENKKTAVLQAHLDMVPQKRDNLVHDFTKDPIKPRIEDGWVKATDTTLGADNGIGMASALAVLFDKHAVHGPLEVLLTMTEETGMDGAFGLQPNWLKAEVMINTDSEQEGEVYVGCAGGTDVLMHVPITYQDKSAELTRLSLTLQGLQGGHSGLDIHLGLGNANKLLARFLVELSAQINFQLVCINGGTLRNAIPRNANAVIAIPSNLVAKCEQLAQQFTATIRNELALKEKAPELTVSENDCDLLPMSNESKEQVLNLLNTHHNGVLRMSDAAEGITETSLNLGVIKTQADKVTLITLVRSLVDSGKDATVSQLKSLAQLANAQIELQNDYPGWQPDLDSPMLQLVKVTHQKLFNTIPETMVIHAGLECGLFKKPYPKLDMVSIGPTIRGAHSPDERVEIHSVNRYWQLLTALLKAIPEKNS